MQKRQSGFEKEKQEMAKTMELKNLQLKELERAKSREMEAIKWAKYSLGLILFSFSLCDKTALLPNHSVNLLDLLIRPGP